jgi:hypothetical protein
VWKIVTQVSLIDFFQYVKVLLAKLTVAKPVNKFLASHFTLPLFPIMQKISPARLLRFNKSFRNEGLCLPNRISTRKPAVLQRSCFS